MAAIISCIGREDEISFSVQFETTYLKPDSLKVKHQTSFFPCHDVGCHNEFL